MDDVITVFGGTGFLGRRIVRRLAERGYGVRVASRRPAGAIFAEYGKRIACLSGDLRDPAFVGAALEGAAAAVNCVSLYVEKGQDTFESVHLHSAEALARRARDEGLRTLVHVSGINAGPQSLSGYARMRGRGDEAVRAAFPDAVILRPSAIFGPGDRFFNLFAEMVRASPVLPLFGSGATRLQPVYVGDVAEAVVRAIENPAHHGGLFELGGPEVIPYRDLLRLTCRRLGLRRLLLPVPFLLWDLAAVAASFLPSPPLTRDQVALMRADNVVQAAAAGFADLGIAPRRPEDVLPRYL